MESWRKVWQEAIAPQLSDKALQALQTALETDDERLLQGATTSPPPLNLVRDYPVEAACVIGFCGAIDHGGFKGNPTPATVEQAEEFFAKVCFATDQKIGEPAACRWFINWADETPRDEMRSMLLPEVKRELARRR